ncbi:MAG: ABC-2 transporter permease [Clostridiales bacterium]|nr:ABC-2 transporter permease [Clostridiales bacterium]
MKGLIIKDLMCLKKMRATFVFVAVSSFVITVMALISARCGNIAIAQQEYDLGISNMEMSPVHMLWYAVSVMVILPLVSIGDSLTLTFEADKASGFVPVAGALPVSVKQRVTARYITLFLTCGTGTVISLALSFILSLFTDIMTFGDFAGLVLSAASLILIFSALEMILIILLKMQNTDYVRIISLLIMASVFIIGSFGRIIDAVRSMKTIELLTDGLLSLENRWFVLAAAAAVCLLVSYFVSTVMAERKRGEI